MAGKEERLVFSLNGGGPWGFRLQGGSGTGLPLIVSKVRRKSKAYRRLREGDRILSVNGRSCEGLTYDQLMDIADKSGSDLSLEILRRECDKENLAPRQESSVKTVDTQDVASFAETSTKISKEGPRVECASVVPESFETLASSKVEEKSPGAPFPSLRDLESEQGKDVSTYSKKEWVTGDDKNYTKTTVDTKQEVKGGTVTSFVKKDQESVSKSSGDMRHTPDITLDTIDLNNLISETQKRLDSFRSNFKTDGIFDLGEMRDICSSQSKMVESASSLQKESARLERTEPEVSKQPEPAKKIPPPTLPKPKVQNAPSSDVFKECLREMEMDPVFSLPDIGFNSQSSETSTVITDIPFGTSATTLTKKKMFSSSSFYEEPQAIYPTIEEQVEMARKIADSLADDTNKKSKGANMFYKRVRRSSNWIHEGPEPDDESFPGTPELPGVEPPVPDQSSFRPSKGPPTLKLVLDPRHALDLNALRSSGYVISEHNVVSPEVCHGLVKDLQSPVGKGAALFAKRKKKSEEWVVDEERVKTLMREQENKFIAPHLSSNPSMNLYPTIGRQEVKLVRTPWEAAMENPYGLCDSAFSRIHAEQLADTVMRRADHKRAESLSRESSRMEGCVSPPFTPSGTTYGVYDARAPKGWPGTSVPTDSSPPPPSTSSPPHPRQASNSQNGLQPSKRMVFQNFNTVPRLWKGAGVHQVK